MVEWGIIPKKAGIGKRGFFEIFPFHPLRGGEVVRCYSQEDAAGPSRDRKKSLKALVLSKETMREKTTTSSEFLYWDGWRRGRRTRPEKLAGVIKSGARQ